MLNIMGNENLNKLIGTWNTYGVVIDGGEYDGTKIKGTDKYEWLAENLMLHSADVTFGNTKQRTIEIFQLKDDGFDMTAYNSDGSIEKMKGYFDDEGIFRAGDDNIRTTLRIDSSGSKMSALWEMNESGSEWMKMSFTK
jgi:hypothetical protein